MKKSIKILLILIFAFAFLSIISKVEAASASISASKSTAAVGDSVTINISFNAASWNLKVSGAGLSSSYADVTSDGENAKTTKSFKLNTSSAGTKTVKLTGDVTDGKTGVTTQVNKSVTVTINKKETNNNNNNSSSNSNTSNKPENNTTTTPTPTFTSVNETVYALSKANVRSSYSTSSSIVGSLKVGDSITRTGIGSNGWSKITYNGTTAYVSSSLITKTKPKEDEKPQEDEETKLVLSSLKIESYDLNPEFSKDIYEYEVNIENDVDDLKIDAISDDTDVTIEIDGNKNLKAGENNITITISKEKTKEKTIYKIKAIKKESSNVEVVAKINQDLLNEEIDRTNSNLKVREWTIRGIIIFVTILIIIMFILRFFTTREDSQNYEYDYVNIREKFNELNDDSEVKEDNNENQEYNYEEESPKINKRNKGKHF